MRVIPYSSLFIEKEALLNSVANYKAKLEAIAVHYRKQQSELKAANIKIEQLENEKNTESQIKPEKLAKQVVLLRDRFSDLQQTLSQKF